MSERLEDNPAFRNWCYTTVDDTFTLNGKPVPLLTTLLYRACDNNPAKFKTVTDALQHAFEAGQKCGLKSSQQEQN